MQVSFDDCVSELTIIRENSDLLKQWERRPSKYSDRKDQALQHEFIKLVKGFVHKHLFQVSPQEFVQAQHNTEHALGFLVKAEHSIKEIEDFDTPFSQSFFFHHWLETYKSIPLWQELWEAMTSGTYRQWYLDRLLERFKGVYSEQQIMDAFHWRFGKYYYSALRELYVYSTLFHTYGIPLKYHLFADMVLSVDGWHETKLLSLYVLNSYRSRKHPPATGGIFEIVEVGVPQPDHNPFGTLWLPGNIKDAARKFGMPFPVQLDAQSPVRPAAGNEAEQPALERQLKAIRDLCSRLGRDVPTLEGLTMQSAGNLIRQLNSDWSARRRAV